MRKAVCVVIAPLIGLVSAFASLALLVIVLVVAWLLSSSASRQREHAARKAADEAIRVFRQKVVSERSALIGQRADSGLWLLNVLSRLLEPIHYRGCIEGSVCIYLSKDYRVLDIQHWVGDVCSVPIPPDAITEHACSLGACGVAVGHNHPNNRPTPSDQDVWNAAQIMEELQPHGISLIEHYVWCHRAYKSVLNTRRFKDLSGNMNRLR